MKIIFSLLASLTVTVAMAQEITVSGTVIDSSDGEPVPYASVHLEGTMTGTSTDGDGNYSLRLPHGGNLVFSSIGYITVKEAVNGTMVLNIVLEPDTDQIYIADRAQIRAGIGFACVKPCQPLRVEPQRIVPCQLYQAQQTENQCRTAASV